MSDKVKTFVFHFAILIALCSQARASSYSSCQSIGNPPELLCRGVLNGVPSNHTQDAVKYHFINFVDNKILVLPGFGFSSFKTAKRLILQSNKIERIRRKAFSGLASVEVISCAHNELAKIDTKAFHGLKTLKSLDLSFNKIVTLGDYPFRGSTNMLRLNLTENHIAKIDSSMLRGLNRLEWFKISSNRLEKIADNAFEDQLKIEHLDFSHQKTENKLYFTLKMFQNFIDQPNTKPVEINIFYNNLKCMCEMNWFINLMTRGRLSDGRKISSLQRINTRLFSIKCGKQSIRSRSFLKYLMQTCNNAGKWSGWGPWSPCSKTCGTGRTLRKRNCILGKVKKSGQKCVGDRVMKKECFTNKICIEISPTFGPPLNFTGNNYYFLKKDSVIVLASGLLLLCIWNFTYLCIHLSRRRRKQKEKAMATADVESHESNKTEETIEEEENSSVVSDSETSTSDEQSESDDESIAENASDNVDANDTENESLDISPSVNDKKSSNMVEVAESTTTTVREYVGHSQLTTKREFEQLQEGDVGETSVSEIQCENYSNITNTAFENSVHERSYKQKTDPFVTESVTNDEALPESIHSSRLLNSDTGETTRRFPTLDYVYRMANELVQLKQSPSDFNTNCKSDESLPETFSTEKQGITGSQPSEARMKNVQSFQVPTEATDIQNDLFARCANEISNADVSKDLKGLERGPLTMEPFQVDCNTVKLINKVVSENINATNENLGTNYQAEDQTVQIASDAIIDLMDFTDPRLEHGAPEIETIEGALSLKGNTVDKGEATDECHPCLEVNEWNNISKKESLETAVNQIKMEMKEQSSSKETSVTKIKTAAPAYYGRIKHLGTITCPIKTTYKLSEYESLAALDLNLGALEIKKTKEKVDEFKSEVNQANLTLPNESAILDDMKSLLPDTTSLLLQEHDSSSLDTAVNQIKMEMKGQSSSKEMSVTKIKTAAPAYCRKMKHLGTTTCPIKTTYKLSEYESLAALDLNLGALEIKETKEKVDEFKSEVNQANLTLPNESAILDDMKSLLPDTTSLLLREHDSSPLINTIIATIKGVRLPSISSPMSTFSFTSPDYLPLTQRTKGLDGVGYSRAREAIPREKRNVLHEHPGESNKKERTIKVLQGSENLFQANPIPKDLVEKQREDVLRKEITLSHQDHAMPYQFPGNEGKLSLSVLDENGGDATVAKIDTVGENVSSKIPHCQLKVSRSFIESLNTILRNCCTSMSTQDKSEVDKNDPEGWSHKLKNDDEASNASSVDELDLLLESICAENVGEADPMNMSRKLLESPIVENVEKVPKSTITANLTSFLKNSSIPESLGGKLSLPPSKQVAVVDSEKRAVRKSKMSLNEESTAEEESINVSDNFNATVFYTEMRDPVLGKEEGRLDFPTVREETATKMSASHQADLSDACNVLDSPTVPLDINCWVEQSERENKKQQVDPKLSVQQVTECPKHQVTQPVKKIKRKRIPVHRTRDNYNFLNEPELQNARISSVPNKSYKLRRFRSHYLFNLELLNQTGNDEMVTEQITSELNEQDEVVPIDNSSNYTKNIVSSEYANDLTELFGTEEITKLNVMVDNKESMTGKGDYSTTVTGHGEIKMNDGIYGPSNSADRNEIESVNIKLSVEAFSEIQVSNIAASVAEVRKSTETGLVTSDTEVKAMSDMAIEKSFPQSQAKQDELIPIDNSSNYTKTIVSSEYANDLKELFVTEEIISKPNVVQDDKESITGEADHSTAVVGHGEIKMHDGIYEPSSSADRKQIEKMSIKLSVEAFSEIEMSNIAIPVSGVLESTETDLVTSDTEIKTISGMAIEKSWSQSQDEQDEQDGVVPIDNSSNDIKNIVPNENANDLTEQIMTRQTSLKLQGSIENQNVIKNDMQSKSQVIQISVSCGKVIDIRSRSLIDQGEVEAYQLDSIYISHHQTELELGKYSKANVKLENDPSERQMSFTSREMLYTSSSERTTAPIGDTDLIENQFHENDTLPPLNEIQDGDLLLEIIDSFSRRTGLVICEDLVREKRETLMRRNNKNRVPAHDVSITQLSANDNKDVNSVNDMAAFEDKNTLLGMDRGTSLQHGNVEISIENPTSDGEMYSKFDVNAVHDAPTFESQDLPLSSSDIARGVKEQLYKQGFQFESKSGEIEQCFSSSGLKNISTEDILKVHDQNLQFCKDFIGRTSETSMKDDIVNTSSVCTVSEVKVTRDDRTVINSASDRNVFEQQASHRSSSGVAVNMEKQRDRKGDWTDSLLIEVDQCTAHVARSIEEKRCTKAESLLCEVGKRSSTVEQGVSCTKNPIEELQEFTVEWQLDGEIPSVDDNQEYEVDKGVEVKTQEKVSVQVVNSRPKDQNENEDTEFTGVIFIYTSSLDSALRNWRRRNRGKYQPLTSFEASEGYYDSSDDITLQSTDAIQRYPESNEEIPGSVGVAQDALAAQDLTVDESQGQPKYSTERGTTEDIKGESSKFTHECNSPPVAVENAPIASNSRSRQLSSVVDKASDAHQDDHDEQEKTEEVEYNADINEFLRHTENTRKASINLTANLQSRLEAQSAHEMDAANETSYLRDDYEANQSIAEIVAEHSEDCLEIALQEGNHDVNQHSNDYDLSIPEENQSSEEVKIPMAEDIKYQRELMSNIAEDTVTIEKTPDFQSSMFISRQDSKHDYSVPVEVDYKSLDLESPELNVVVKAGLSAQKRRQNKEGREIVANNDGPSSPSDNLNDTESKPKVGLRNSEQTSVGREMWLKVVGVLSDINNKISVRRGSVLNDGNDASSALSVPRSKNTVDALAPEISGNSLDKLRSDSNRMNSTTTSSADKEPIQESASIKSTKSGKIKKSKKERKRSIPKAKSRPPVDPKGKNHELKDSSNGGKDRKAKQVKGPSTWRKFVNVFSPSPKKKNNEKDEDISRQHTVQPMSIEIVDKAENKEGLQAQCDFESYPLKAAVSSYDEQHIEDAELATVENDNCCLTTAQIHPLKKSDCNLANEREEESSAPSKNSSPPNIVTESLKGEEAGETDIDQADLSHIRVTVSKAAISSLIDNSGIDISKNQSLELDQAIDYIGQSSESKISVSTDFIDRESAVKINELSDDNLYEVEIGIGQGACLQTSSGYANNGIYQQFSAMPVEEVFNYVDSNEEAFDLYGTTQAMAAGDTVEDWSYVRGTVSDTTICGMAPSNKIALKASRSLTLTHPVDATVRGCLDIDNPVVEDHENGVDDTRPLMTDLDSEVPLSAQDLLKIVNSHHSRVPYAEQQLDGCEEELQSLKLLCENHELQNKGRSNAREVASDTNISEIMVGNNNVTVKESQSLTFTCPTDKTFQDYLREQSKLTSILATVTCQQDTELRQPLTVCRDVKSIERETSSPMPEWNEVVISNTNDSTGDLQCQDAKINGDVIGEVVKSFDEWRERCQTGEIEIAERSNAREVASDTNISEMVGNNNVTVKESQSLTFTCSTDQTFQDYLREQSKLTSILATVTCQQDMELLQPLTVCSEVGNIEREISSPSPKWNEVVISSANDDTDDLQCQDAKINGDVIGEVVKSFDEWRERCQTGEIEIAERSNAREVASDTNISEMVGNNNVTVKESQSLTFTCPTDKSFQDYLREQSKLTSILATVTCQQDTELLQPLTVCSEVENIERDTSCSSWDQVCNVKEFDVACNEEQYENAKADRHIADKGDSYDNNNIIVRKLPITDSHDARNTLSNSIISVTSCEYKTIMKKSQSLSTVMTGSMIAHDHLQSELENSVTHPNVCEGTNATIPLPSGVERGIVPEEGNIEISCNPAEVKVEDTQGAVGTYLTQCSNGEVEESLSFEEFKILDKSEEWSHAKEAASDTNISVISRNNTVTVKESQSLTFACATDQAFQDYLTEQRKLASILATATCQQDLELMQPLPVSSDVKVIDRDTSCSSLNLTQITTKEADNEDHPSYGGAKEDNRETIKQLDEATTICQVEETIIAASSKLRDTVSDQIITAETDTSKDVTVKESKSLAFDYSVTVDFHNVSQSMRVADDGKGEGDEDAIPSLLQDIYQDESLKEHSMLPSHQLYSLSNESDQMGDDEENNEFDVNQNEETSTKENKSTQMKQKKSKKESGQEQDNSRNAVSGDDDSPESKRTSSLWRRVNRRFSFSTAKRFVKRKNKSKKEKLPYQDEYVARLQRKNSILDMPADHRGPFRSRAHRHHADWLDNDSENEEDETTSFAMTLDNDHEGKNRYLYYDGTKAMSDLSISNEIEFQASEVGNTSSLEELSVEKFKSMILSHADVDAAKEKSTISSASKMADTTHVDSYLTDGEEEETVLKTHNIDSISMDPATGSSVDSVNFGRKRKTSLWRRMSRRLSSLTPKHSKRRESTQDENKAKLPYQDEYVARLQRKKSILDMSADHRGPFRSGAHRPSTDWLDNDSENEEEEVTTFVLTLDGEHEGENRYLYYDGTKAMSDLSSSHDIEFSASEIGNTSSLEELSEEKFKHMVMSHDVIEPRIGEMQSSPIPAYDRGCFENIKMGTRLEENTRHNTRATASGEKAGKTLPKATDDVSTRQNAVVGEKVTESRNTTKPALYSENSVDPELQLEAYKSVSSEEIGDSEEHVILVESVSLMDFADGFEGVLDSFADTSEGKQVDNTLKREDDIKDDKSTEKKKKKGLWKRVAAAFKIGKKKEKSKKPRNKSKKKIKKTTSEKRLEYEKAWDMATDMWDKAILSIPTVNETSADVQHVRRVEESNDFPSEAELDAFVESVITNASDSLLMQRQLSRSQ